MGRQNGGKTSSSGIRVSQETLKILILRDTEDTQLLEAFHLARVSVVVLGLYEYDAVVRVTSEVF